MKPTKKSYDDSCSRPNKIMKTPALRKSKYYINTGSFRHHNNCGSTHPSMAASEENKLPPSFSGFKSQKFLHESTGSASALCLGSGFRGHLVGVLELLVYYLMPNKCKNHKDTKFNSIQFNSLFTLYKIFT